MRKLLSFLSLPIHPKVGWGAFLAFLVWMLIYELNLHAGWHPGAGEWSAISLGVYLVTGYTVPSPGAGAVPVPVPEPPRAEGAPPAAAPPGGVSAGG